MRSRNLALFTVSIIVLTSIVVYSADAAGIPKKAISTFSRFMETDLPTTTVFTDQANTYTAGQKQTFQNSATTVGFNIAQSADPSTPTAGDFWFSSTDANSLKYRDASSNTRTLVDLSLTQTLTGKTMDGGSNTFTNIPKTALPGTTLYTDQASTIAANHQFGSTNLLVENPAKTKAYTLAASAITNNRTLTLPLITNDDTFDTLGLAQTFTAAKTFPASGIILGGAGAGLGTLTYANSGTSGTVTIPAGTDTLAALGGTQTFTGTNTFTGIIDLLSSGTEKIGSSNLLIRNPGSTFAYTVAGSAITANRTITIPLTTQDEILAVQPIINFSAAQNQTGTNSLTGVMYGDGVGITPAVTGRVEVTVFGYASVANANRGCAILLKYGTGFGPAAGAAPTGTTIGNNLRIIPSAVSQPNPFSMTGQVTGLTIGTHYWFELHQKAVLATTCTISNTQWSIKEI